jgi:hypothetical protein
MVRVTATPVGQFLLSFLGAVHHGLVIDRVFPCRTFHVIGDLLSAVVGPNHLIGIAIGFVLKDTGHFVQRSELSDMVIDQEGGLSSRHLIELGIDTFAGRWFLPLFLVHAIQWIVMVSAK